MSKRVKADLQKVTLNLRAGDWDYIESLARPQGMATSEVVRILISNFVDKKRAAETPTPHINVRADL